MKIALGTAQFGLPYGIANTNGQISEEMGKEILDTARNEGIDIIDTAIAYGESEKCLGNIGVNDWSIVTKLPEVPADQLNVTEWINIQFGCSLDRLNVDHISAFMLHRPNQLLRAKGDEIWIALQDLKAQGRVDKIGYSIYSPTELDLLVEDYFPDIVQAPGNVIDQRLKSSGWLKYLHDHNVEVHIRSVFLQGLLLMKQDEIPEKFNQWEEIFTKWNQWLNDNSLNQLEGCLWPIMSENMYDCLVVGVDSVHHLKQILSAVKNLSKISIPEILVTEECALLNPAKW